MKSKSKSRIIIVYLIFFCLYSCNNEKTKITSLANEDPLVESFRVEVVIKDTLIEGKRNFGDIIIYNKLRDSIKRSNKDVRIVTSCLNIFESNKDIIEINEKECDTFYQATDDFENSRIPFYIVPKKTGNQIIGGLINEDIYLYAYKYSDTSLSRYINFEHRFSEKVYVVKNNLELD
ncbi:hypothetical protein [Winogradskyella sp.]|uniref:hypothetical protein n=1 Tax=Winogradskyella sp. TaxID=1883156 RepID=UPI003BAAD83B